MQSYFGAIVGGFLDEYVYSTYYLRPGSFRVRFSDGKFEVSGFGA